MKPCIFLLLAWLVAHSAWGQRPASSYQYRPATEDYFKGFRKAKLKLNYYFTDGSSMGNRYSYEVVLIDSLLLLGFTSPQTDDYRYISYQKKLLLSPAQLTAIKTTLASAKLKQRVKGLPMPDYTAYNQEVLIIKYKNVAIAGGMIYANRACFPDDEPEAEMQQEIRKDRRLSSSISGNYDLLLKALRKYFVDLASLKQEARRSLE